ncbi:hypothetical protein BH10PSE14_BH10PSE14_04580 [soil metagenome]
MSRPIDKPSGVGRRVAPRPSADAIQAVRARLSAAGITLTAWAEQNGEDLDVVNKVLSGRRACTTGKQHRVAVKLGLKDGAIATAPAPAPAARTDFGAMEPAR